MPVLVVGAGTPFARTLCAALLATGGQVRAYVHDADAAEPLRSIGVHCAIGGPLDVERLESACAQVHTVIHLAGPHAGRRHKDEAEAIEVTSIAAHAADVVRVVVDVPGSGRAGTEVRKGIERFAVGRCFEVVICASRNEDEDAIEALIDADARR